jgi:hypothetical protein
MTILVSRAEIASAEKQLLECFQFQIDIRACMRFPELLDPDLI